MTPPVYLHTPSHMAAMAEVSVATIQRILNEIGARPMFVFNLCPHYEAEIAGTAIARAKAWTHQPAYHRTYFSEVRTNG